MMTLATEAKPVPPKATELGHVHLVMVQMMESGDDRLAVADDNGFVVAFLRKTSEDAVDR